jgi:tetratricopeptide (TPR) repeat protein
MKRIFFLLLVTLYFSAGAQVNIDHYMRVGQTRTQIGNYTGAIEYFNIVLKFKPKLAEAYFYRGIAKHQLEDYRGGISDYNTAIDIKPFYPQAYLYRGMAYHNLKNYPRAIEDYNKALEFDPDNENIYNNRGLAKLAQKDLQGAIEDYNKALKINPKSTYALMNRSNAKIVSGDTRGAIKDLNEVIVIRPHYAGAYLNRGLARFEMEDYASALRDFDQSIKFDPQNALAFNNRGIVKQKLEDYAGAIMDYNLALQLNPEMANAYFNRAMAKEVMKIPGYENDYAIAAQLNPKFDLEARRLKAEEIAKAQRNSQKQQTTQNKALAQNQSSMQQDTTKTAQNQPLAANTSGTQSIDEKKEDTEKAIDEMMSDEAQKNSRNNRKLNLMIEDSRELPGEEEENTEDGLIQNRNIVIDLQPLFIVSAFEKNSVDYDRFQYYNEALNLINIKNNYNPLLTLTHKSIDTYKPVFENFILFFNDKNKIQENSHNLLNRGIFYSLTGKYNQAVADFDKTVKIDDKQGIAWFERANAHYKMLEQIEMLEKAQNDLSVKLGEKTVQEIKQENQTLAFEYKQILDDYEVVLYIDPSFYVAYYNRAFIKLRLGEYKSAIEDLNRAIEIEPEFAEAYFNRGLTKIFMNDNEGGANDLSRAGELGIYGAYNVIKRYCN